MKLFYCFALVLLRLRSAFGLSVCGTDGYDSPGGLFSYNPDAWNPSVEGFQCLAVHISPPSFNATWRWRSAADTVHSYPHVKFLSPLLPIPLVNISKLQLQVGWSMTATPTVAATQSQRRFAQDTPDLAEQGVLANVAFDMFADLNPEAALRETAAQTEIMVWIGRVGDPKPLGFDKARADLPCLQQRLGQTTFVLYHGSSTHLTNIFTWVGITDDENFVEDISPLLQYLWRNGLVDSQAYLGLVEFGSEAYHAPWNITFSAYNYSMDLQLGEAPDIEISGPCSIASRALGRQWRNSLVQSAIILLFALWIGELASKMDYRHGTGDTPRRWSWSQHSFTVHDPFADPSDASSTRSASGGESSRMSLQESRLSPSTPTDIISVAQATNPQTRRMGVIMGSKQSRASSPIDSRRAAPAETTLNEKATFDRLGDPEQGSTPLVLTLAEKKEESGQSKTVRKGLFSRMYAALRRTYCPIEEPPLVLPTGPTDTEKELYLHTNRIWLYIFGVLSFLSLSAGMWLFSLCSTIFVWYGVFVGFLDIYLFISYLVGVVGRDWDFGLHRAKVAAHPINAKTAPSVDVYLPCCSEPLVVIENTYKHIAQLDWPAEKLRVYVLDDGNQEAVRTLAAAYGFEYIVRDDRPRLRKAGNLRWAFARTHGDFFAIFDADFCPRPDFLKELIVEHLADDKVAIVQSPQFFRVTSEQSWVEQGAGATQELFYRVVQVNRDKWGASICVGSNALYRRAALEDVGGTAEIGFSEDVHTGFGALDRGWKVKYVPLCLATGICPNSPRAFFSQQMRWARGSTTLLTTKHFWVSNLTWMQKTCYLCGLLYYTAISLGIFISPLPGPLLLIFRPEWFKYYNLAFAIPSIAYGAILFRVWSKASYGFNVQHIMVVQSYAYLTAIKDRLFGIELLWAASGDSKAHKSNKYRNMRLLAWFWAILTIGGMITVVIYRIVHHFPFYHTIPLLILNSYNLYINHRFLFCNW